MACSLGLSHGDPNALAAFPREASFQGSEGFSPWLLFLALSYTRGGFAFLALATKLHLESSYSTPLEEEGASGLNEYLA